MLRITLQGRVKKRGTECNSHFFLSCEARISFLSSLPEKPFPYFIPHLHSRPSFREHSLIIILNVRDSIPSSSFLHYNFLTTPHSSLPLLVLLPSSFLSSFCSPRPILCLSHLFSFPPNFLLFPLEFRASCQSYSSLDSSQFLW